MDFTFGIITDGTNNIWIELIINSIQKQNIPNYEIIIVGGNKLIDNNIIHVDFDETIKPMWITKKKNIITQLAKYDNIVYMHDYIVLDDGWYQGWLEYGDDFKACMNQILNFDGTRFRDWILGYPHFIPNYEYLLDYDILHLSKMMYFSGAYWVAKKSIMQEIPLDETKIWGQGEDAVWSNKYREKYQFNMNKYSIVKLLKQKDPVFNLQSEQTIKFLKSIDDQFIINNYRG